MVKLLSTVWETWVRALGWEDPLEKEMAIHSRTIAWKIPWTARRSNQSILKEINPGISLEGMMLKLKLQYFGHFMRRVDSLERL